MDILNLTKQDARRFLLAHHHLWPPRSLAGKAGIMAYIDHIGCIQYDPINVVGRNPDLVLQARVGDYRPELLTSLLYQDRVLLDGWDKLASIYRARDWPYFSRHRALVKSHYDESTHPVMAAAPFVRHEIAQRGPLSSIDLDHSTTTDWMWGRPVRQVRAILEVLYATGELGIHRRLNTRRYYDFMENILPAGLLEAPDPNVTLEDYHDWHVLRRVGSSGLASPRATEYWLGIVGLKAPQRRAALERLVASGALVRAALENGSKQDLYMRAEDLPTLQKVWHGKAPEEHAVFLAPLDNMLWDRNLLRLVFDFDYIWEVYKPAAQRNYGYYVLPVLYGDRFIARFDPNYERKSASLVIRNWWWETGVEPDQVMLDAIQDALANFAGYLGAEVVRIEQAARDALGTN